MECAFERDAASEREAALRESKIKTQLNRYCDYGIEVVWKLMVMPSCTFSCGVFSCFNKKFKQRNVTPLPVALKSWKPMTSSDQVRGSGTGDVAQVRLPLCFGAPDWR